MSPGARCAEHVRPTTTTIQSLCTLDQATSIGTSQGRGGNTIHLHQNREGHQPCHCAAIERHETFWEGFSMSISTLRIKSWMILSLEFCRFHIRRMIPWKEQLLSSWSACEAAERRFVAAAHQTAIMAVKRIATVVLPSRWKGHDAMLCNLISLGAHVRSCDITHTASLPNIWHVTT
jgi:hypothetical protein